jgi:hypothetical protein
MTCPRDIKTSANVMDIADSAIVAAAMLSHRYITSPITICRRPRAHVRAWKTNCASAWSGKMRP